MRLIFTQKWLAWYAKPFRDFESHLKTKYRQTAHLTAFASSGNGSSNKTTKISSTIRSMETRNQILKTATKDAEKL